MEDAQPEIKTEFRYQLSTPLKYHYRGDEVEAAFIVLSAPTSRHMKECSKIKQAFMRAIPDSDADATGEGGDMSKVTGHEIMAMIAASDKVELGHVLDTAKKLFTSGLAMIEGETRLTSHLVDEMSLDDFELMTGEYIANFTLPSLVSATRERSSPES